MGIGKIYSQKEMLTYVMQKCWDKPFIYARKNGVVKAVRVTKEIPITTVLMDGTIESMNTAHPGDWIVTNPSGESYAIPDEVFLGRYELVSEDTYRAKGDGVFVKIDEDITFEASWGETAYMKAGAYLSIQNPEDIYGIANAVFKETYSVCESFEQVAAARSRLAVAYKRKG